MYPIDWYDIRNLPRVKAIVDTILKDPYLPQTKIAVLTGIPRTTVSRIINTLVRKGVITKRTFLVENSKSGAGKVGVRYEVAPLFVSFLKSVVNDDTDSKGAHRNGRGFPADHHTQQDERAAQPPSLTEERFSDASKEEIEAWAKDGVFRVHGFQRKYRISPVDLSTLTDENTLSQVTTLLNSRHPPKVVRIGRKKTLPTPIIFVPSPRFRAHYRVHIKKTCMIISASISIPWDDFTPDIEQLIVHDIRDMVERLCMAFATLGITILAHDEGWVGRKKPLRPEVGFIDPDGIIRKVRLGNNNAYIEGVGYWVDGSLREAPELEFPDAEKASLFKQAVEKLATGSIYNEVREEAREVVEKASERVKEEVTETVKETVESTLTQTTSKLTEEFRTILTESFKEAISATADEVVKLSYAGGLTTNQQITQIWKAISELQEMFRDMLALMVLNDADGELKQKILKKLAKKFLEE